MGRTMKRGWICSFVVLIACLLPVLCNGQQVELRRLNISQVSPPSAGIPIFSEHPDKAAIIIESSVNNLTFNSNMDGIVDHRSEPSRGRYVLIIEPYTQIIIVNAPGYIQGRFRVGSPNSRDILYYQIDAEEREPDLISVFFDVTPDDAKLFVDNQQIEINQTVQMPPGPAEIRLEREGYKTFQSTTMISSDNIMFNYELEEVDIVPVHFITEPSGASVIVDNMERGQTDESGILGLFMYPGEYVVSIQSSGYISNSGEIIVSENEENRFEYTLDSNIGELTIHITPSDARVLINREDFSGETNIRLIPGRYRLEVEKNGYAPHSELIEIVLDEEISRNIELTPYTGNLQFEVTPANANVILQDSSDNIVREWQGIEFVRNLPVGKYKLTASYNEYNDWKQEIKIKKNETNRIDVKLEKVSYASLKINVGDHRSNGKLFKDGVEIESWNGDVRFDGLPFGLYNIKYPAFENYRSWEKEIMLDSSHMTIDVNREKSKEYTDRRLQKTLGYVISTIGLILIIANFAN